MIEQARKTDPTTKIVNEDLMDSSFNRRADFFIVSGTYNMIGGMNHDEWKTFFYESIKKMYELSNVGVVFNTLNHYSTFYVDNLFYLDPREFIEYSHKHLSRFINIKNSSPLFENTISIIRPEHMKKMYGRNDFEKYL